MLQRKEVMQRSESYQFCCLPVSHASVDISPSTICFSAPDGPAMDGPAVDGPAVDGPAVDGPAEERVSLQLVYISMHRSIYIRFWQSVCNWSHRTLRWHTPNVALSHLPKKLN